MGTFCWVYRGYLRLERRGCLNIASESNFKILLPWTPWTSTSWCSMSSTPPEPAHYLHMIEHQSQLTVAFCIPKKVKSASVFWPIVNFKVGSLSLNRFFEEHIPRWNIITMINWMSSKKPFERPFSTTMDEPESDTREWHQRVTLERNPQSEACEGHQIVVKLVSEWHKRVKKESDTTRGDSRGHSENMLERTHVRWMCYI